MKKALFLLVVLFCISTVYAQKHPSLIPLPRELRWETGYFDLNKCTSVQIPDRHLEKLAIQLMQQLNHDQAKLRVGPIQFSPEASIVLSIDTSVRHPEGYHLEITPLAATVRASTPRGIFYGLQTFYQLKALSDSVPCCSITDWPAFGWRGYMIDVGRNYQSPAMIRQQIDIMARYKLNIFHFHATEDVAWRFASRQYPQLNDPANMIRNKGCYYTEQELKELIQYCNDRFITFVPEIDMPGHSGAFRRALGFDMQSDSGMAAMENILDEFLDTYPLPYLHIGGDEVKITNNDFLPQMIALVQSKGVQTIGWSPGGNVGDKTIRQLWMDDAGKLELSHLTFIDSRHLYLNHMDPFEGVTTLFNRMIGDVPAETRQMKGATLCLWPDRRVAVEEDAIRMNLVYPGMLAYAERAWQGGGYRKWVANIGSPGEDRTQAFIEFENRLLNHKSLYFKHLPFPYVAQQSMVWQLFGPYNNQGNVSESFGRLERKILQHKITPYTEIVGATVVLRHWWAPLIEGAVDDAAGPNTTWFATTRIWSDKSGYAGFWIGFNNLSRSPATDSPPAGAWDAKGSMVKVNGKPVAPPRWARGGAKGNSEIPLTDEGYEYREATVIKLKAGWNHVLVKAPVASLKGPNWENPVKWMFTFVRTDP